MDPAACSRGDFNRGRGGTWKGRGKSKLAKGIRALRMGEAENRTLEMCPVVNHWMDGFICAGSVSVGDEQMSAHDSHFTYSSGMLPSLGARSNRRVKLGRFLISPYDRRYRAWETFLILLVIYSAWVSPFELAFIERQRGGLFVADLIVNFFFAIDIIMTFFVVYLDRRTYLLEGRRKSIAKRLVDFSKAIKKIMSIFPS